MVKMFSDNMTQPVLPASLCKEEQACLFCITLMSHNGHQKKVFLGLAALTGKLVQVLEVINLKTLLIITPPFLRSN